MKSKVIKIQYSSEEHDVYHYRVCEYKDKKCLIGWVHQDDEDDACDITDWSDLSLYHFERVYMQLAIFGHLLDLERTVCEQTPIFTDNDWKIAKAIGKTEKE